MTPTSSRGTLGWLGAVLAGGISAAAFAYAFANAETMLVFLAYFSPLPLFVAGLGAGAAPALLGTMVGVGGVYALNPNPYLVGVFAIAVALPVALFCLMALRNRKGVDGKIYWYPEGYLITAVTLYPCLAFIGLAALMAGQEGGLLGQTAQILQTAFGPLSENLDAEALEGIKAALDVLPRILPALIGCSWIFLILISLVAAQSTLRQQKWNLRDAFSWRNIVIPNWLVLIAGATGAAGFLAPAPFDYLGVNIFAMTCVPFFFVGLAVIHALAATTRASLAFLIVFYIALTFFSGLALLVVLIGSLEQGLRFRQRMARLPQRSHNKGE